MIPHRGLIGLQEPFHGLCVPRGKAPCGVASLPENRGAAPAFPLLHPLPSSRHST